MFDARNLSEEWKLLFATLPNHYWTLGYDPDSQNFVMTILKEQHSNEVVEWVEADTLTNLLIKLCDRRSHHGISGRLRGQLGLLVGPPQEAQLQKEKP